jgi:hypothetical protein
LAGVIPRHCATCSRPSPMLCHSKRDGHTLEESTAADLTLGQDSAVTRGERSTSPPSPPTQCGHSQPCTAIPSAVEPSPAPWKPCSDGGASMSAPVQHKCPRQQDPRTDVRTTTRRGYRPDYPRSYSPASAKATLTLVRTRIRQDIHQIAGTVHRYHYTVQKTMRHVCNPPPLSL